MNASPTPVTGSPLLEVSGLSVDFAVDNYWVPAAKKLNYSVESGKALAIVGESGSGKSASSMAMLGLLPSNARVTGSVKLAGREILGLRKDDLRRVRGREIAVIFQEPMTALNPVFTVGFQIIETLRIHQGMTPSAARTRALELLDMVELPDPLKAFNSYPHQLSGGQRQRAMIAQSISCDPQLLIADEPTTALDVTVQAEILDLMRDLRHRLDSAILIITHDMGVVADIADDIVVMRKGEIVERGSVDAVFNRPTHPYTQQLLAAVPRIGDAQGESIDTTAALAGDTSVIRLAEVAARQDAERRQGLGAPVLDFQDVAIDYPKRGRVPAFRAVEHANFSIYPGEVTGLVGESGSGKTTVGRAAIGLLPIAEGRAEVVGSDISKADRRLLHKVHKDVGIVFQDPSSSLNPRLPIGQSIGEPMLLAGVAKGRQLDVRVQELLDSVELPRSYRNRYPHELSGGQKQRVGIARALSLQPKLLIADEPTSALDVSVQATVLQLLRQLQADMGFACLFISHDLAVVDSLADRIIVMHHGKIVEQGATGQILRAPKEDYTRRLIAAIPVPDPEEQRVRREARAALLEAGLEG
ncbi:MULTISPECIES: ABC transporter ATP-binding protein [Microbacterium]|uniref:Glutathione import ATP-binding protein GsiA n=1 Tax=Microbacterium trichothecenolyticum TaxID=69370 RepID=A0A0M2HMI4_MICTR|nr:MULTISPECIES: ABC transporter ATP-binding protein [Microbacterium]KJL45637.1 Glutathione import ATP-binding protein GsiA [Microbacterium trichothecenolyticum]MDR7190744.1 peptide/nickel transport system ATP-binding protein [Microbacterium sp. BE35]